VLLTSKIVKDEIPRSDYKFMPTIYKVQRFQVSNTKMSNPVSQQPVYCKVLTTKNVETGGTHAPCSNDMSQTKWCEGID